MISGKKLAAYHGAAVTHAIAAVAGGPAAAVPPPKVDGSLPPPNMTAILFDRVLTIQRHLVEAQARLHSERDRLFGPQPIAASPCPPEARNAALPDLLALLEMVESTAANLDEDTRFLMEI